MTQDKEQRAENWKKCCAASNRLMDLVCYMYHPNDKLARLAAPTSTWAEIIASELALELPEDDEPEGLS